MIVRFRNQGRRHHLVGFAAAQIDPMKLGGRGDAGVPQGPRAPRSCCQVNASKQEQQGGGHAAIDGTVVGGVSSTWAGRTSIITTTAPLPPQAEGSSAEASAAPTGCIAAWCASFPERSGGISASNTAGRKPVGLRNPHQPCNSLPPLYCSAVLRHRSQTGERFYRCTLPDLPSQLANK